MNGLFCDFLISDIRATAAGALHAAGTAPPEAITAPAASYNCLLRGQACPSLATLRKEAARLATKLATLATDFVAKYRLPKSRLKVHQCRHPRNKMYSKLAAL